MMRKSNWIILLVSLSFLFVSAASAGMYVGIKGGYQKVGDMGIVIPAEEEEPPVMDEQAGAAGLDFDFAEGYVGDLEFDGGWVIGAAVGTTIEPFRVEGELEYRRSNISAADVPGEDTLATTSLMLNGYYDFQTDSSLTPYIGAGIGWARHDISDADVDDSGFAYQGTIGVAYALSDTMALDFAYRYFATADPDFEGLDASYDSHNLTVGLRFGF
ncbi:MAG: porin family protein [Desulfobacteraceae bacterium]|nr:porin family protein [Desulfobacteraceae bacterium]